MSAIRFAKMSGAGNDFLVFDNRQGAYSDIRPDWIRRLCTRRMAVGADGLLLLDPALGLDFAMRYFNADGSEAAMCGNGARCLSRFAVLAGAAGEGAWLNFSTAAGQFSSRVEGSDVALRMRAPETYEQDILLRLAAGERQVDFTNTGVPHAVLFTDDLEKETVEATGREIRFHQRFQPAGTNVNFCRVRDAQHLEVRTYERGVEAETLACGTGVAAAALLAARRGWVQSPVQVRTRSGVSLEMSFNLNAQGWSDICQRGEARFIYWGELTLEADQFTENPGFK